MTQLNFLDDPLARTSDCATSRAAAAETLPRLREKCWTEKHLSDKMRDTGDVNARSLNTSNLSRRSPMPERDSICASKEKLDVQEFLASHSLTTRTLARTEHDLSGTRFSKLIGVVPVMGPNGRAWLFRCDCGNLKAIRHFHDVRHGKVMSCGCWNREMSSRNGKRRRIHGHKGDGSKPASRAYRCWYAMKQRCLYKKQKRYKDYGARGISVCDRWMTFVNFLADMGDPPSDKHSLDRFPNGNGNYEPGNVRWATPKEQGRNQKTNRLVDAFGETKCIAEWAEDRRCAVLECTLGWRLKHGWNPERAITTPSLSVREVLAVAQAARWPKR